MRLTNPTKTVEKEVYKDTTKHLLGIIALQVVTLLAVLIK